MMTNPLIHVDYPFACLTDTWVVCSNPDLFYQKIVGTPGLPLTTTTRWLGGFVVAELWSGADVMNKCPKFSERDTEWSEWSFFESVAGMANVEPVMEGAFNGLAEKTVAELTPELLLGAKQSYCLLVYTVRGTALTLARSAENHHGIAAQNCIKTEYQRDAAGRHTAMLTGVMQLGWDSRGAANTFLDQLSGNDGSKSTKVKVLRLSQTA